MPFYDDALTAAALAASIFFRNEPFSDSAADVVSVDFALSEFRCDLGRLAAGALLLAEAVLLRVTFDDPAVPGSSGAAAFLITFLCVTLGEPALFTVGLPLIELRFGLLSSCDATLSLEAARDTTVDLDLVEPESLSKTPFAAVLLDVVEIRVDDFSVELLPADVGGLLLTALADFVGVPFSVATRFLVAVAAGFFVAVPVFFLGFSGEIVSLLLVLWSLRFESVVS